jgi:hypothetical protein
VKALEERMCLSAACHQGARDKATQLVAAPSGAVSPLIRPRWFLGRDRIDTPWAAA